MKEQRQTAQTGEVGLALACLIAAIGTGRETKRLRNLKLREPGTLAGGKGTVDMILGKVVEIHVADEVILPGGKLDYASLKLLGRAGYWDYSVMDETFSMKVPGVSASRMAAMEGRRPNAADAAQDAAQAAQRPAD